MIKEYERRISSIYILYTGGYPLVISLVRNPLKQRNHDSFFHGLSSTERIESFSFHPFSLEAGLDFISYVCAQPGDQLLSVHFVDQEVGIEIPVTAFAGVSFSNNIRGLEQAWQALLPKPVARNRAAKKLTPKS